MTRHNIVQQLRQESQWLLDRGVITRGQRLVVAGLMRDAADSIEAFDLNDISTPSINPRSTTNDPTA
jgi:hypothetical protein